MSTNKIVITPDMILSAPGTGDPSLLFDEVLDTFWFPGWNVDNYPAKIVLDLKDSCLIEAIKIFDFEGTPTVRISLANNSPTDLLPNSIERTLDGYLTWHDIPLNDTARYIIIELLEAASAKPMGQIEVYGIKVIDTDDGGGGSGDGGGGSATVKIPIEDDMIIQSPNVGVASNLFDGDLTSHWFPGWNPNKYPAKVVLDLKSVYQIKKIRMFDNMGIPDMKFIFGLTSKTDVVGAPIEVTLDGYQSWKELPVNLEAQFVVISLENAKSDKPIGEIEFHGYLITEEDDDDDIIDVYDDDDDMVGTNKTGDAAKIGANSFHWVPVNTIGEIPWVREYQYWSWMEAAEGINTFEPAGADANYDAHYDLLKQNGIKPIACINTTPTWLNDYPAGTSWNFDHKPKPFGSDGTDPNSYKAIARFVFQLAARYGRAEVSHSLLTIDTSTNTKKSGLNLLEYIEIWNEPDKWWAGAEAKFSPEEYAAMLSACYDGHEGTLGTGHGIKNADPTMKVIMGGLTNFDTEYITRMNDWFKSNRNDQEFCSVVLNFHHYSNSTTSIKTIGLVEGISPEEDNLRDKIKAALDFRDAHFPGMPVWLTEIGYDTTASPQAAKPIGNATIEQTQARWLVRTLLECIAAGIDRTFIYNLTDVGGGVGLYQSCGLVGLDSQNYARKPAWQSVMDLITALDGKTFKGDNCLFKNVKLYTFENEDGTEHIAYGWSPTSDDGYYSLIEGASNQLRLDEVPKIIKLTRP